MELGWVWTKNGSPISYQVSTICSSPVQTLGPEIARITGLAELHVDHGDGQVEKLGIDCTQHGRLQPTRHRNVVRVYSPARFCQLAFSDREHGLARLEKTRCAKR